MEICLVSNVNLSSRCLDESINQLFLPLSLTSPVSIHIFEVILNDSANDPKHVFIACYKMCIYVSGISVMVKTSRETERNSRTFS